MISLETFLRCVRENAARIHGYELGHDGSDGKSDCIGLIIGALGLAGFRWPGVHGSNWAARNAMSTFGNILEVEDMYLGEIVYKAKLPGASGYELPDKYKSSGDLRDYYHVGVVTGVNPLQITHCTSRNGVGGVYVDNTMGNWRWGGELKYVDYEEDKPMDKTWATVYADNGKTVNMRQGPDKRSVIIARVPVGEEVTVIGECESDWVRVSYGGKTGYMMREYLLIEPDDSEEAPAVDGDTVTVSREDLETWADVLEEMARDIRDALGHG